MIVDLLKQLAVAFGRYVAFHVRRILGFSKRINPEKASNSQCARGSGVGLDATYLERVPWPVFRDDSVPLAVSSDPLYRLWSKTPGGQKWSQYFSVYREIFAPLVQSPVRLLEIGVYQGASLDLWKKYFAHPETVIVGIDIEPSCARFDSPDEGKRVRIGSQADSSFLHAVVQEFGPFDLIIDDGSHRTGDVIASFNHLFSSGLKDSGIYFVEDLHAGYWPSWRNSQYTFLDVCKELVEIMHAHYAATGPNDLLVDKPSDQEISAIDVPRLTTMIKEIRFFDSIVAIYKTRSKYAPFLVRRD